MYCRTGMDYNNNPPLWGDTRSYTSLLMDASYAPIQEGSASQEETDLDYDIHVDAFGVDHEDDKNQSEEDKDDDIDAMDKAVMDEAPNPNWNMAIELEPVQINS